MPIILLTNENTASSSEILAGALKDNRKHKNSRNKNIWKRSNSTIINIARW